MTIWLKAARLRTLPLALATVLTGTAAAYAAGGFRPAVLWLTLLTALLLQVLSNLANDLGDFINGADTAERRGPQRVTQAGIVTARTMIKAIAVTAAAAFISGAGLVIYSLGIRRFAPLAFFALLGISAIAAALKYTLGKKPYGYSGLGDGAVLVFFGPVGVLGSYYLQTLQVDYKLLLPALALGLLAAGVLNINNMRDLEQDEKSGKHTLAVMLGAHNARRYHLALTFAAFALSITFFLLTGKSRLLGALLAAVFILLFILATGIVREPDAAALDRRLRQQALLSLLYALAVSAGIVWG